MTTAVASPRANAGGQRFDALPIRTPEGVEFSLPLAGPVTRLLAMLVDLLVVGAMGQAIGAMAQVLTLVSPDIASAVQAVTYFVVSIGYSMICEWRLHGQTLGKRVFRLRVVDAGGLRLEPSQIVLRNLLRLVDGLPVFYLLGGVVCLLNARMQRLGDIAGGTVVVRTPEVAQPDLDQILGSKYNSLLEHRHLCARLRQKVSPDMAALALQALLRREGLEAGARLQLFQELAGWFRKLVPFPDEVAETLGDEQYVRNVVEVLYRK